MRCIQIRFQIWYRIKTYLSTLCNIKCKYDRSLPEFLPLNFDNWIPAYSSYFGHNSFQFLNYHHTFSEKIDWDISLYGKLWTYNLNYFDYLNQENSNLYSSDFKDKLQFYAKELPNLKSANEPFPTSLRIINWIKYFTKNKIYDKFLNESLYNQCHILKNKIEYHLMGNHLLENGFALTLGGIYFQDIKLYKIGKKILSIEFNEQILKDGAHFELSPMYHSIMLSRLLDIISIFKSNIAILNNSFSNQDEFLLFLSQKASLMISWIENMVFKNDQYPHFNDSTFDIAFLPTQLVSFAKDLGIGINTTSLSDSGYRRLQNKNFDLIIKAGKVGPDYIPGHAHADSLSFECHVNGKPYLVDPGITTYDKNDKRQKERSTKNHNTITIENKNSSDVWGGFRVGKRAVSTISSYTSKSIDAFHNGYGVRHSRSITVEDNSTQITDTVKKTKAEANFHFHPALNVEIQNDYLKIENTSIKFENLLSLEIADYDYSLGFNKSEKGTKVVAKFYDHLITTLY
jgi:hypothetical protein